MTDADPMIEFVTARLSDRKAVAQGALKALGTTSQSGPVGHDPERTLAEIEATRRIIANARTTLDGSWQLGEEAREATAFLAVRTLQHLAELDADHPDYDPGWKL
jgi:predicted pyridoxine 5'-phosphate oxidase superfamily flavin-nucleotide-binding protein